MDANIISAALTTGTALYALGFAGRPTGPRAGYPINATVLTRETGTYGDVTLSAPTADVPLMITYLIKATALDRRPVRHTVCVPSGGEVAESFKLPLHFYRSEPRIKIVDVSPSA